MENRYNLYEIFTVIFLVYIFDLLYIIWYTPKYLENKIWLKIKNMIGI